MIGAPGSDHEVNSFKHPSTTRLSRENASDGPLDLGSSASPSLGTRDGVAGDVTTVDVVLDTSVRSGVERGASNAVSAVAARVGGTRAGDLNVDALRVALGAILLGGGVEGDDLVAKDVVARGERLGDGDSPLVAVGDELVRGPLVGTGVEDTSAGKLEEAEAGLVGLAAVARALGEVVDNGTVVGLGPGVPLESHVAAGLDSDGALAGGGFL